MGFSAKHIPYSDTGAFSSIALDYLRDAPELRELYAQRPDIEGIKQNIAARKPFTGNRALLVKEFKKQYAGLPVSNKVNENVDSLLKENTFTVCTAHQPNIFTGHLYFIYKIIHAIKLADELNAAITDVKFVPVYYMGSEDADLDELGEVYINGKSYKWNTAQKGAVGRMLVDKAFIQLIDGIEAQLLVEPYGKQIIALVRKVYTIGRTIEQATLELVHSLFAEQGLLVLLPDNVELKRAFIPVVQKELNEQFSEKAVAATVARFPEKYKVQAAGRPINLFYLKDDMRERIEQGANGFDIANTQIHFTKEQIQSELHEHPERFSANVILRPVYQEMILPNIAFIGGAGELAYWLELKAVFDVVAVPFPVIILRNSFMVINKKTGDNIEGLPFTHTDYFKPATTLVNTLVEKETALRLSLNEEMASLKDLYAKIGLVAGAVDRTLVQHTDALHTIAMNRINELEKKIFRAEKRKFSEKQLQVEKIKAKLFPNGTLQERIDNLLPYYAIYGQAFLDALYAYSTGLSQQFCILEDKG